MEKAMDMFRHVRHTWSAISVVAGASVLLLAASACGESSLSSGGADGGGDKGSVKLGLLVPLSGVYAPLGRDMRNGFELYLAQHGNKLGGKTVELVVADEGGGPDTGLPAGQKLVTRDQVAAVAGVVNSATAISLRDVVDDAKVPLIVANAGANAITGAKGSPYVYRTSFSNAAVNEAFGATVAKEVAGGKVYAMAPDYLAGQEQIAGFKKTFLAAGGRLAGEQYTPFGKTQDFQPYLSAVRRSGAKAVYAFYSGAEAVSFVKQYAQFGLAGRLPLYGPGFLTEGSVLAAQGDAALGVRTSLHYSTELDNPANKKFVADYTAKYGSSPTVFSVQSWDAATALDKALAKASGGAELAKALGEIGAFEDSPRGPWRFGPNRGPDQPFYQREVRKQGAGLINAVVGELAA
jgi:branched-chain amino acid transport system substrate-binding protein